MPGMGFGFGFGFHRRASGSGASAQLLTLATAAGAEAVYDPDNPDTWTLRDDGSDLWYSAISDGLGNREDMVQATAANQEKQITLSNGRRARLVQADQFLVADFASEITQPNTILVVGRRAEAGVLHYFMDSNKAATGGRQILGYLSSTENGWGMWAGSWLSTSSPAGNLNWHIEQGNYNGASSELFLGGASIASGDAGTNGLGGIADTGSGSMDDTEIGPVIVFSGLKTNAELSDIRDHLNANWPIGATG